MSYLDPRLQHDGEDKSSASYQRPQPYYSRAAPEDYSRPSAPVIYEQSPASDQLDTQNPAAQSNTDQDDPKRPRACESCRGLKVRCDQDPANPDAPCRRCAKANRQCVYTQPSRKRQKKADTRVADLEKKLDALTAALQAQHYPQAPLQPLAPPVSRSPAEQQRSSSRYPDILDHSQQYASVGPSPTAASSTTFAATPPSLSEAPSKKRKADTAIDAPARPTADVIPEMRWPSTKEEQKRQICAIADPVHHQRILDRFVNECVPTLPIINLPPDATATSLLEEKPVLMLSILATAGFGILHENSTNDLITLMIEAIADVALRRGAPNFEMVQAMLNVVLWIKAPQKPERSGFYMTVHLAVTMAIDLGLGKRFNPARAKKHFMLTTNPPCNGPSTSTGPLNHTAIDSDSAEGRRTWLACFYCAAAASMVLRRPNLVRWTSYMEECVDFLEKSPSAIPSDALFCQYVRLQKICDDISIAFKMDDPTATGISISDPKVSYQLGIYEQRIKDWESQVSAAHKSNQKLMFFYHVTVLYLHEISLHVNHNVDDFQLPFTEESLKGGSHHSEILTQRQMASLEACLTAAHQVISIFCGLGVHEAATTPTLFYFVRSIYALIVLFKMHLAVTAPGSEVAKIITPEKVQVMENMEMIWALFCRMDQEAGVRPPPKAMRILNMLREWLKLQVNDSKTASGSATASATTLPPFGRDVNPSSKLQVLSEAATAGHNGSPTHGSFFPSATRSNSQSTTSTFREDIRANPAAWTVDSPNPFSTKNRLSMLGGAQSPQSFWARPEASTGSPNLMMYGGGVANMGNTDWMAGMDLDQLLNGAFDGFDTSGDMGQFFLGDGIGAYQLPVDNNAPAAAAKPAGRWT